VRAPRRSDILSVFTGIRPLVKPKRSLGKTSSISRDHTIDVSPSGLITITGGKWTTARKMAQDCVDQCIAVGHLSSLPCRTAQLCDPKRIHFGAVDLLISTDIDERHSHPMDARGDGSDGRRCLGPANAMAVSGCRGCRSDGTAGRILDGSRIRTGRRLDG
jgi:glycerol-3-phosphate dehydrogenase